MVLLRAHQYFLPLLQIGANDLDEFVGTFGAISVARDRRTRDVRLCVILDHFRHESAHRAADSRDLLHDFCAALLRFEGPLQGFHLAADPAHASEQIGLFPNGVAHERSPESNPTTPTDRNDSPPRGLPARGGADAGPRGCTN